MGGGGGGVCRTDGQTASSLLRTGLQDGAEARAPHRTVTLQGPTLGPPYPVGSSWPWSPWRAWRLGLD